MSATDPSAPRGVPRLLVTVGGGALLVLVVVLWPGCGERGPDDPRLARWLGFFLMVGLAAAVPIGILAARRAAGRRIERRGLVALFALAIFAAALAGPAFLVYTAWWDRADRICGAATRATSVAERQAGLGESRLWAGDVFGDPVKKVPRCAALRGELERLAADGACPVNLPVGVPCRCGTLRWPDDAPCSHALCAPPPIGLWCFAGGAIVR